MVKVSQRWIWRIWLLSTVPYPQTIRLEHFGVHEETENGPEAKLHQHSPLPCSLWHPLPGRVILIQKILFLQLLHGFKLFHLVSNFQNSFCFWCTTLPSAVRKIWAFSSFFLWDLSSWWDFHRFFFMKTISLGVYCFSLFLVRFLQFFLCEIPFPGGIF